MSDVVLPFVATYLKTNELRELAVGRIPRLRQGWSDFSGGLKTAASHYQNFDYRHALSILTALFEDEPPRFADPCLATSSTGANQERLIRYRDALLLFDRAMAWIGFQGMVSSPAGSRGAEILDDVDRLTSLIGDRFSTASARAFRLRQAGAPAEARRQLNEALHFVHPPQIVRDLEDAAGALSLALGEYEAAVTSFSEVLTLDDKLPTSRESIALAEAFRSFANFGLST